MRSSLDRRGCTVIVHETSCSLVHPSLTRIVVSTHTVHKGLIKATCYTDRLKQKLTVIPLSEDLDDIFLPPLTRPQYDETVRSLRRGASRILLCFASSLPSFSAFGLKLRLASLLRSLKLLRRLNLLRVFVASLLNGFFSSSASLLRHFFTPSRFCFVASF